MSKFADCVDTLLPVYKYGEPHRNSSSEITLTSSSWIKGAQCKLGCSTYGIWQQPLSNSAWCHNQVLNFLVYIVPCLQETPTNSLPIQKHSEASQHCTGHTNLDSCAPFLWAAKWDASGSMSNREIFQLVLNCTAHIQLFIVPFSWDSLWSTSTDTNHLLWQPT
jgi:hypothetical protein